MIRAIFAGSFDPPTLGHLDIIQRSRYLCDELIVAVAINPAKKSLFDDLEKVDLLKECIKSLGTQSYLRTTVQMCSGLLVDFAKENKAEFLIRGIRTAADFEYEYNLAKVNRKLDSNIQAIFLPANEELSIVSSSMVKELAKYKRDVSEFVPPCVAEKLKNKFLRA